MYALRHKPTGKLLEFHSHIACTECCDGEAIDIFQVDLHSRGDWGEYDQYNIFVSPSIRTLRSVLSDPRSIYGSSEQHPHIYEKINRDDLEIVELSFKVVK